MIMILLQILYSKSVECTVDLRFVSDSGDAAHPELPGAELHAATDHKAVAGLENMEGTRDVGEAEGADEDWHLGFVRLLLDAALAGQLLNLGLVDGLTLEVLLGQKPQHRGLHELVGHRLPPVGEVGLQRGRLAHGAFGVVVKDAIEAHLAERVAAGSGDGLPEQPETERALIISHVHTFVINRSIGKRGHK